MNDVDEGPEGLRLETSKFAMKALSMMRRRIKPDLRADACASCDEILAEKVSLPPLPTLAREASEARAGGSKRRGEDDYKARLRATQWQRWYSLVREVMKRDGVDLVAVLLSYGEIDRATRLVTRLETQARSLRDLALPHWPLERVVLDPHRDCGLLDVVEDELARANTVLIRGGQPLDPKGWF